MLCRASCGFEPRFHFDRREQLQHTGAGPFKITSLGGARTIRLQVETRISLLGCARQPLEIERLRFSVTYRFREVVVFDNLSISTIGVRGLPFETEECTATAIC